MPSANSRGRAQREALRRSRLYTARQTVYGAQVARRRRDNIVATIVFLVVVALATVTQIGFFTVGPGKSVAASTPTATPTVTSTPTATATATGTAPPASAAEDRTWTGTLTLNSVQLGITLDGKKAPKAVANFVTLAKKGFYTGLTCHRETTGSTHILQCGDPKGDGSGGPGYSFGPIENAPKSNVYATGVIAMAREGDDANSQGSQFFIVYGAASTFPADSAGGYTVFGRVTRGLAELRTKITDAGVTGSGDDTAPKVKTIIRSVSVH